MKLTVLVLAAGRGSRIRSKYPKVLQKLASKYLIEHVLDTVTNLKADKTVVVYGHLGHQVKDALNNKNITWVEQSERLGTGHAVMEAMPYIDKNDKVLILYGDVPLISYDTLRHFIDVTTENSLGLLTATVKDPTGLGRIIRNRFHEVEEIVEEKDASDIERQIKEINTGIYCVSANNLNKWLPRITNDNAQKEYYLTDIVSMARTDNINIKVAQPIDTFEISGVNTRSELAHLERTWHKWQVERIMAHGVSVADPDRIDIRGGYAHVGQDTWIDINVILDGQVSIGDDCSIGANCIIKDSIIEDGVEIKPNSILDGVKVKSGAIIGPFARLRPKSIIGEGAKIGNFVEIKKSVIDEGSKVNHLSYIGDSNIGKECNIGAGVITCNYDGANKHKTTIEDDVHIGSDCQLIAPVTIKKGATIGAGSTINRDVPEGKLTLSARMEEVTKSDWIRPKKTNKNTK